MVSSFEMLYIFKIKINRFFFVIDLVLKLLSSTAESYERKETFDKVEQMIPMVKEIATNYKKPGVTATE